MVRLIGDDQQLAAVAAGGTLRDIQRTLGAVTLSEVRRFADHAEAAATLAIREGDAAALGFYADHQRIHVGDLSAVTDQAYTAWTTDRAAGLDSVLLAPTRDLVAQLNARARTDRLTANPTLSTDAAVTLNDGNQASAGDVIITKRNDRTLALTASDWVKNGDRWTVTGVHPNGSITARHHGLSRTLRLPAGYVADHVQLGYASTVHAAQGLTTDTTHAVLTGTEARQLLYVALSRGRRSNHLYLATGHDGDPHSVIRPDTLSPPTALDVLTEILERDGAQHSATTTRHNASSPATQLHDAVTRYLDALHYAAEQTLTPHTLTTYDTQIEAIWPGLTHEPAYPALRSRLALLALDDHDPLAELLDATQAQPIGGSHDRAAVLVARLDHPSAQGSTGPIPWLEAVPGKLAENDPGAPTSPPGGIGWLRWPMPSATRPGPGLPPPHPPGRTPSPPPTTPICAATWPCGEQPTPYRTLSGAPLARGSHQRAGTITSAISNAVYVGPAKAAARPTTTPSQTLCPTCCPSWFCRTHDATN